MGPENPKHPFQVGNNVYILTFSKTHKKSVVADLISTFIHLSVVLYPINIKKTEPIFYVVVHMARQIFGLDKVRFINILESSQFRTEISSKICIVSFFTIFQFNGCHYRKKCMERKCPRSRHYAKSKNSMLQNFIIDYQIVKQQPEYTFPCTFGTKFSTKSMRHTVSVNK